MLTQYVTRPDRDLCHVQSYVLKLRDVEGEINLIHGVNVDHAAPDRPDGERLAEIIEARIRESRMNMPTCNQLNKNKGASPVFFSDNYCI